MATTTWQQLIDNNPQHTAKYIARWERLEDEGADIVGEARLIDAMAARGSRILDAGAGTGRIGGYLASQGHKVTGVDLDPGLVDYAQRHHPDAEWTVGNLSAPFEELPQGPFDLVVSAGNVLGFIEPGQRGAALNNLRRWVTDPSDPAHNGRIVVGFGLDRGWGYSEFLADCAAADLLFQHRFSSWSLEPFEPERHVFLVAVLAPAARISQNGPASSIIVE